MIGKTRGLFAEFKSFAIKGNVLELAIAVVIGGAFGKIVSSLVADIITPLMAMVSGGAEVKHLAWTLRQSSGLDPAVVLNYGMFLQNIFDFLVIALSIFMVFKLLSVARQRLFLLGQADTPQYEKTPQERLLEEIRDLLTRRK